MSKQTKMDYDSLKFNFNIIAHVGRLEKKINTQKCQHFIKVKNMYLAFKEPPKLNWLC